MITGGTGSGDVNEAYTVSLVEGLKAAGLAVDGALAEGYATHIAAEEKKQPAPARPFQPRPPIPERAVVPDEIARAAREADAALVTLGRNAGEGRDRKVEDDFLLSAAERALLQDVATAFHAQKKKVVVVLNIGGVIETASWRDVPDAILLAWQPGQESGHAIADVLTGRTPPSGKIATTFPMKWEDVPSSANFPGKTLEGPDPNAQGPFRGDRAAEVEYTDDIFVGYRHFATKGVKTAYPFGFGLSYTQFRYSDLKLSSAEFGGELKATVTVTNTGSAAGREVVQLYVSAPGKALPKPALELRGFAKTKTLKPGDSETVSFTLAARDLASFDEASSSWRVEAGTYTVKIGASSEDVRQTAIFTKARDEKVASVSTLAVDQVKTASGLVQAAPDSSPTLRVFQGIPFAAPPVGDLRWKAPQPVQELAGRPAGRQVRPALHAARDVRRHGVPQQRDGRGLSLPERLDARPVGGGAAAGARVLLRRRLPGRRRIGAPLRRREHGRQGHRGAHGQLPARRLRLPRAPRVEPGGAVPRVRQLRPPRPERRPALGAGEHRRVRRRPEEGDDRGRVGGLDLGQRPGGLAALEGPDRRRHHGERIAHRVHDALAPCPRPSRRGSSSPRAPARRRSPPCAP